MTEARILLLDIETAPILASVWGIWQENVGLNQISRDWHLLSFAAKWLGEKRVFYEDQASVANIENDKELLKKLHALLDEADIVVTQNGISFDIPKIRARMAIHGLKPPSPFKQVDTKREAKKLFGFTSNRLEYLSRTLGVKTPKSQHKRFPGFELWKACLAGNKRAWAEMKRYNIVDILALEGVYLKLRPWIEGHPNVGLFADEGRPVCPKCGGKVQKRGYMVTQVGRYQRYQCQSCGGYSRSRKVLNHKTHRANQLTN